MAAEERDLRRRMTNIGGNASQTNTSSPSGAAEGTSNNEHNTRTDFPASMGLGMASSGPYKTATEYNQAVQQWVWQYQMYTNMMWVYATMPFMSMGMPMGQQAGMMPPFQSAQPAPGLAPGQPQANIPAAPPQRVWPHQQAGAPPVVNLGQEFRIPALWKRVLAEFIDFILLFLIKLGVTLLTVEYVGGIDIERYDIELLFSQNIDYDTAYALTYELVAMEIINRILICIFETLCLRRGVAGMVGGTTPGKRLMQLRVVSCEDIVILPDNKVRVSPASDIGLWNALVRSVIKNFSLAFFFPVCFTVFFFQQNRAAYDVIASCIVVEAPNDELLLW